MTFFFFPYQPEFRGSETSYIFFPPVYSYFKTTGQKNRSCSLFHHVYEKIQHKWFTLGVFTSSKALPVATFQNLVESLPTRMEAVIAATVGPTVEWDVQQALLGMMVRCLNAFVHIVYIHYIGLI